MLRALAARSARRNRLISRQLALRNAENNRINQQLMARNQGISAQRNQLEDLSARARADTEAKLRFLPTSRTSCARRSPSFWGP